MLDMLGYTVISIIIKNRGGYKEEVPPCDSIITFKMHDLRSLLDRMKTQEKCILRA